MKRMQIIIWVFIFMPMKHTAQNLINNPSFEDTIPCSIFPDIPQLRPYYWFQPTGGSSDFFNTSLNCAWGGGVPSNAIGYQFPRTGSAFLGFAIWEPSPFINRREYIEGILTDTLLQNHTYCVQFYVSASNNCSYLTDDIGAFFSIDSVAEYTNSFVLPYMPQVENVQGNILNDTLNWMLVSGSFTAQGGEKFITIGNFRDDANTTLVFLPGSTINGGYYFIDDVSVVDCTVGVEELGRKMGFNVRPNPAKDFVEISLNLKYMEHGKIEIFDILGNLIKEFAVSDLENNIYMYTNELNAGVYCIKAIDETSSYIETKKLTIIK